MPTQKGGGRSRLSPRCPLWSGREVPALPRPGVQILMLVSVGLVTLGEVMGLQNVFPRTQPPTWAQSASALSICELMREAQHPPSSSGGWSGQSRSRHPLQEKTMSQGCEPPSSTDVPLKITFWCIEGPDSQLVVDHFKPK